MIALTWPLIHSQISLKFFLNLLKAYYAGSKDVILKGNTSDKFVALTFDDGPHPVDDAALLDVLDKHGVKATFFLLGKHMQAFRRNAEEISKRGHEIGNHSFSHNWSVTFPLSQSAIEQEILETNKIIKEITGISPSYFRPPRLVQGKKIARVLKEHKMQSVIASAFTLDFFRQDDPQAIFKGIKTMIRPGCIIVLHSGHADHGKREQERREGTIKAVDLLLFYLKENGYGVGTVTALLER